MKRSLSATLLLLLLPPASAQAADISGRLALYGTHLSSTGDVDEFTDGAWGGGLAVMAVIPGAGNLLGVDLGVEAARFEKTTIVYQPTPFDFRRELTNSQDLFRLFLGLQVGPHGHGFLQPYAAVHGTLVNHSINTTLTEPDDVNPDLTHTQTSGEGDWGTGYDLTLGTNLNFWDRFGIQGGVRYLRTFGLNEPLGDEAKTIDPEYVEVFLGASITFDYLDRLAAEAEDEEEE